MILMRTASLFGWSIWLWSAMCWRRPAGTRGRGGIFRSGSSRAQVRRPLPGFIAREATSMSPGLRHVAVISLFRPDVGGCRR
jgi:hypothetical protein